MVNSNEARVSGEILKWARTRLSLTLEDAAEKIEVTQIKLAQWEKGNAFPTIDELFIVSEVYGLPVSMFYLNEPPKSPLLERDKKAKKAFEYLKLNGFTADDYQYELGKNDVF